MANYKVLGQSNPTTANTLVALYTVPDTVQAFCSTISICNQGSVTSAVRVAVQPMGAAINAKHYIVYDQVIVPNDSIFLTIGLALDSNDICSVQASTSSVSFSLFGSEI